jgi:gliding motility-associated-like protein
MRDFTFFVLLFLCGSIKSQNLVLNPSFEEKNSCEFICSALDTNIQNPLIVKNWCSATTSGTPDYFNTCQVFNPYWYFSIPINRFGIQKPFGFGESYAGIGLYLKQYSLLDSREYLQAKIKKLKKQTRYCAGFYTSLAESDSSKIMSGTSKAVISNWGMLLSKTRLFEPSNYDLTKDSLDFILTGNPQIKTTVPIIDTSNWVLVHDVFIAEGGEEWLTIGNFNEYLATPVTIVDTGNLLSVFSYVFIDQVFVIPMDDGGLLPNDTSLCASNFPITITAFDGFLNYQWADGGTARTRTFTSPGTYALQATYEGCTINDTIRIALSAEQQYNLADTLLCLTKLPLQIIIPDNLGFSSITWSDGQEGKTASFINAGVYSVSLFGACGEIIDTFEIATVLPLIVDLGIDISLCIDGQNTEITLQSTGILPNYQWSSGENSETIVVNQAGSYSLQSENLCGTVQDEVKVAGCAPKIYIPNAINTSSKDPYNTIFLPKSINSSIISLDIYDRWGEHIFHEENVSVGWDGTYKNKPCVAGVYAYYLKLKDATTGEILEFSGDMTLF